MSIFEKHVSDVSAPRWLRSITLRSWNVANASLGLIPAHSLCSHIKMRHTQCIMGQGRLYVSLALRIRAVYFLFVPASKFHRPFSNLWVWIKILIIWAAVSSKDLKRAAMLLVVYVISFLLFCHQTGQCIINGSLTWNYDINESFQLFQLTNILTRIFYVIF